MRIHEGGAWLLVWLVWLGCQASSRERSGEVQLEGAPGDAAKSTVKPHDGRGTPIWSGESGGARIDWTTEGIFLQPPSAQAFKAFEKFEWLKNVGRRCEAEQDARVLSVVGPIVSYELSEEWFCELAAHPTGNTVYSAVDAAHPCPWAPCSVEQKTSLTDLFPDADLFRALTADPIVRRQLPNPASRTTRDLVWELSASNTECQYAFHSDLLNRFAFHHIEGNRVAVRIGLSHGCEVAHGTLTQLGILLPIPPRLREALDHASTRVEGFLMRDSLLISNRQKTSIRF